MRSIWKGHIQFSLVMIPIRIYSAVDTAKTVSFNLLHKEDNGRVGYEKKCKKCGKAVSNEQIIKGYQYEPDQYVTVEEEDLQRIKLKSTKVIEIKGFVEETEVSPMLYDSPYYAGPDGAAATKAYGLLRQALKESGKVGIGKVVFHDREDAVVITPHEQGIVLYKIRYPEEIRDMNAVPQLDGKQELDRDQLKLAENLLQTMTTSLDKIELTDTYEDALKEIIDAKIQGKEIVVSTEEERPAVDIMTALKQSIEQAKSDRGPMVKATGGKKKKGAEKQTKGKKRKGA